MTEHSTGQPNTVDPAVDPDAGLSPEIGWRVIDAAGNVIAQGPVEQMRAAGTTDQTEES